MPKHKLDTAVNPAEIVDQTFAVERRGFDQRQVRAYLSAVADSLNDAQQREAEMRSRIARSVRRAETAEQALRDMSNGPTEANREVGDNVASVLDAARTAGEQRTAAAEKSAKEVIDGANVGAARLRRDAERVLEMRQNEAETAALDMISEAQAEAQTIRNEARADATTMLGNAADRVAHACEEADTLVHEAVEARAQILEDMDRRRRHARAQVERLRVGRDRLLRSYEVVRRTLEETTVELKSSLQEAKVRGDTAGRAVAAEAPASREQLEAELLDAKLIGRVQIGERAPLTALDRALRSPALPRKLDPPQESVVAPTPDAAPTVPEPRGSETTKRSTGPKAPAVAPLLAPSAADADGAVSEKIDPIAAMIAVAEEKKARRASGDYPSTEVELDPVDGPLDEELAQLEDQDLNVIEPSDEIENVRALAADGESSPEFPGIEAERDALIADATKQLERQLNRALADEQNELLAGIQAAKKNSVELTTIVGDIDSHVNRYVTAINQVAVTTYGAGAALIDAKAVEGLLPAGAVEELLAADLVLPIREQLQSLDGLRVAAADMHVDPVRSFYLQRKTDHLGFAASRLANLLCVAGVCDALPVESELPWSATAK